MDFRSLDEYMAGQIERGVPGCELAVCRKGETLYHACAGHSDLQGKRASAPDDQYLMFSCTKPITAACAMRCIQDGLFALEDPVSRYLPAYANAYTMENGQKTPLRVPMTIRHLFTMTGGLNYNMHSPAIERRYVKDRNADTIDFACALIEDPLDFQPGEKFQYSLCHDVLAAIVESVTGMNFGAFVQKTVFGPLGMKNSGFYLPGAVFPHMAQLYQYDGAGLAPIGDNGNNFIRFARHYSGGAGLVSTVEDYLRFANEMACGETVLTRASIDRLRREELTSFRVDGSFSCTCGDDYGYGLGVRTRVKADHGHPSSIGEFGWDGAAGADALIDPEHGISIFYAQHILNWPPMLGDIHAQIRDRVYPVLGL